MDEKKIFFLHIHTLGFIFFQTNALLLSSLTCNIYLYITHVYKYIHPYSYTNSTARESECNVKETGGRSYDKLIFQRRKSHIAISTYQCYPFWELRWQEMRVCNANCSNNIHPLYYPFPYIIFLYPFSLSRHIYLQFPFIFLHLLGI